MWKFVYNAVCSLLFCKSQALCYYYTLNWRMSWSECFHHISYRCKRLLSSLSYHAVGNIDPCNFRCELKLLKWDRNVLVPCYWHLNLNSWALYVQSKMCINKWKAKSSIYKTSIEELDWLAVHIAIYYSISFHIIIVPNTCHCAVRLYMQVSNFIPIQGNEVLRYYFKYGSNTYSMSHPMEQVMIWYQVCIVTCTITKWL